MGKMSTLGSSKRRENSETATERETAVGNSRSRTRREETAGVRREAKKYGGRNGQAAG